VNGRLWLGALGYIAGPFPLLGAFLTHAPLVALPLLMVGAFLVGGAGPALDAVRVDVVVPRLRGRTEAIRQMLRTLAEAGAPLVFGVLAGMLAGGTEGLRLAFMLALPFLLASGLIALIALRTYAADVTAALAVTGRDGRPQSRGSAHQQTHATRSAD
jgi:MFS family permease